MLVPALAGGHHAHADESQHGQATHHQVERVEFLRRLRVGAAWREKAQHGHGTEDGAEVRASLTLASTIYPVIITIAKNGA